MLNNTRQKPKPKSDQINDVMPSRLSSISMPSLVSRPQPSFIEKSFEIRRNNPLMRQKTTAETISETRRMLSNG